MKNLKRHQFASLWAGCLGGAMVISPPKTSAAPTALGHGRAFADTIVLRPRAGGEWRTSRRAVVELRLDGVGAGAEFGEIQDVLALTDGGVAVFDGRGPQGPALVVLDSMGRLLRRLGRRGAGPGEFGGRANLGSLAEGPDREIWLLDAINNRINRWSRDGEVLPAIVPKSSIGPVHNIPLIRGPNGTAYAPAQVRSDPTAPFGDDLHGAFLLALTGEILDTIRLPARLGAVGLPSPYAPRTLLHPLPTGGTVSIRTHTASVILSGSRGSKVVRVELPIRAASFQSRERAELIALTAYQAKQLKSKAPEIPVSKPLLARIQVSTDGATIWLLHPATGVPAPPGFAVSLGAGAPLLTFIEPTRFLALRTDGTFRGQLEFEGPGIRKVSFHQSSAWGIVTSADGTNSLVKWRLPT